MKIISANNDKPRVQDSAIHFCLWVFAHVLATLTETEMSATLVELPHPLSEVRDVLHRPVETAAEVRLWQNCRRQVGIVPEVLPIVSDHTTTLLQVPPAHSEMSPIIPEVSAALVQVSSTVHTYCRQFLKLRRHFRKNRQHIRRYYGGFNKCCQYLRPRPEVLTPPNVPAMFPTVPATPTKCYRQLR